MATDSSWQRAGTLLKQVERAERRAGKGLRASLAHSDIPETTAKRWQAMAAVPETEGTLLKQVERKQGRAGAGLRTSLVQSEIPPQTAKRWQAMAVVGEVRQGVEARRGVVRRGWASG